MGSEANCSAVHLTGALGGVDRCDRVCTAPDGYAEGVGRTRRRRHCIRHPLFLGERHCARAFGAPTLNRICRRIRHDRCPGHPAIRCGTGRRPRCRSFRVLCIGRVSLSDRPNGATFRTRADGSRGLNGRITSELRLAGTRRSARVVGRWPTDDKFDSLLHCSRVAVRPQRLMSKTKSNRRKVPRSVERHRQDEHGARLLSSVDGCSRSRRFRSRQATGVVTSWSRDVAEQSVTTYQPPNSLERECPTQRH